MMILAKNDKKWQGGLTETAIWRVEAGWYVIAEGLPRDFQQKVIHGIAIVSRVASKIENRGPRSTCAESFSGRSHTIEHCSYYGLRRESMTTNAAI